MQRSVKLRSVHIVANMLSPPPPILPCTWMERNRTAALEAGAPVKPIAYLAAASNALLLQHSCISPVLAT